MKTSALRIAGASVLLIWGAVGLSACGNSAGSPDTAKSPAAPVATPVSSATATPAPTQTQARAYTSKELTALVAKLKDAHGKPLTVMSTADLKKTIGQAKSALASISVEPAECAPLALGGQMPSPESLAAGAGLSQDAATGAVTGISLASVAGSKVLSQGLVQSEDLKKCSNLSVMTGGTKVDVKLTKLGALGSTPGSIAYRTDTALPDGQMQSAITGQVLQNGVLFTVSAAGGASEADAVSRAGKLLDQAAALVGK
ncbi:hypothetical protein SAMN04487916_102115 [Arthrobacter sp. ov407]|uniref:hypothetical protein n=1 Tax=Arthrobacter sp. ov407 TaxID=1761748 RepID=UPI0008825D1C|nr:hypothetical protein [Arthrobacter sp. ov407]SDK67375.1 hypothetical protein SAMN04487916_102115 [Arthrobacter sp. ov407]